MIIVFFHMLYLIGKMMYENYHFAKRKDPEEVQEPHSPAYYPKKRHADDPFDLSSEDYENVAKAPRFYPPAYIQRYIAVQKVLVDSRYRGKIKKVVDFGCSELGFIDHLKQTPSIEEILFVDVDRATLKNHMFKAIPVNVDYLQNRPNPLTIHVYEGSVTQRDKKLANSDAVVAIELIEHLYPDTLMDFPYNIFGYINPLVVVITTPNADFNVLFSLGNKFRHWDHKFEWTRLQFEDWANNIVSRYPEYQVSFQGVGPGPSGKEHLGCCTQMAVFHRIGETESLPICGIEGLFKLVTCQEYPYRIDNRSDEQKILDDASYYMRRFSLNNPECTDQYPLKSLLTQLEEFYISTETLREILVSGGYTVVDQVDGAVVLCPPLSTFSDTDDEIMIEVWNADSGSESTPYLDNFGNAEPMYEDKYWDGSYGYELPEINLRMVDETQNSLEALHDIAFESTRSPADTEDLGDLEVSNESLLHLVLDAIDPICPSSHSERLEYIEDKLRDRANVSSNVPSTGNPVLNQNQNSSVECKTEAVTRTSASNSPSGEFKISSAAEETQRQEECSIEAENSVELGSLCSMYLEASRNEDRDVCPENITNSSFDCTALERSLEKSRDSVDISSPTLSLAPAASELHIQGRLSMPSALSGDLVTPPQFASSPKMFLAYRENGETEKSMRCEDSVNHVKSVNQTSLQINGNVATATTTSSNSSSSTVAKFHQLDQSLTYRNTDTTNLDKGNEISDNPAEESTSESGDLSPSESMEANNVQEKLHVTRLMKQRAPESLELRSTTNSKNDKESLSTLGTVMKSTCSREAGTKDPQRYENGAQIRVQMPSYVDAIVHTVDESLAASTHKSNSSKIEECGRLRLVETCEIVDATSASPDAPETPPNSWSPEIMDSGYPNSSFTQDMTPEYDLSSIAQDRVSDSESPSVAEAPRLGFVDHAEVENGDLANNNRDDEGNNMIAEAENDLEEDLQPLIDVIENDLENENDIYALENGFPVWLLRILERGNAAGRQAAVDPADPDDDDDEPHFGIAVGDAGMPDPDEGFDSTSSEDENIEDVSTESSEETIDWNASGDYY